MDLHVQLSHACGASLYVCHVLWFVNRIDLVYTRIFIASLESSALNKRVVSEDIGWKVLRADAYKQP